MNVFKRNDRVAYLYGGSGTVTSKRGNVVRVLWDDGFETPVHGLEICHVADAERYGFPTQKENDRSISDQESAAALTETSMKETITIKTTNRAAHHESLRAPAGFHRVAILNNLDDPYGLDGYEFHGPRAEQSDVLLCTKWTPETGIRFELHNSASFDEPGFTRDELNDIPALIEKVTRELDHAHAKAFFQANPKILRSIRTVMDFARLADSHGLSPVVLIDVHQELCPEVYEEARVRLNGSTCKGGSTND